LKFIHQTRVRAPGPNDCQVLKEDMNGFLHVGLAVLEKIFYHRSLLIF
jgi:hypothetical protein